eukprot:176987_1
MQLTNFYSFVKESSLLSKKLTRAHVHEMFVLINVEESYEDVMNDEGVKEHVKVIRDDPENPDNSFNRGEFMESIVRLAHLKFCLQSDKYTIIEGLQKILEEYVLPQCREVVSKNTIRTRLLNEDVHLFYVKWKRKLFRLFKKMVEIQEKDTSCQTSAAIREKTFISMFMDCPETVLMDGTLSVRTIQQAFALSQNPMDVTTGKYFEMAFQEFFEGLARTAEIKMQKEVNLSFVEKFEKFVDILTTGYGIS